MALGPALGITHTSYEEYMRQQQYARENALNQQRYYEEAMINQQYISGLTPLMAGTQVSKPKTNKVLLLL